MGKSFKIDAQGRDGSFMKLFRYISGANASDQKISMTTPVFMKQSSVEKGDNSDSEVQMGFVIPKEVGFGWLVGPTRLPLISHALDFGYRVFAKNRLRLTGRCTKETCQVN